MAGGVGAQITASPPGGLAPHAFWFGEDQGRYVLAVAAADADGVLDAARQAGVPAMRLGTAGGDGLTLPGCAPISVETLRAAHGRFFPAWMEQAHGDDRP